MSGYARPVQIHMRETYLGSSDRLCNLTNPHVVYSTGCKLLCIPCNIHPAVPYYSVYILAALRTSTCIVARIVRPFPPYNHWHTTLLCDILHVINFIIQKSPARLQMHLVSQWNQRHTQAQMSLVYTYIRVHRVPVVVFYSCAMTNDLTNCVSSSVPCNLSAKKKRKIPSRRYMSTDCIHKNKKKVRPSVTCLSILLIKPG